MMNGTVELVPYQPDFDWSRPNSINYVQRMGFTQRSNSMRKWVGRRNMWPLKPRKWSIPLFLFVIVEIQHVSWADCLDRSLKIVSESFDCTSKTKNRAETDWRTFRSLKLRRYFVLDFYWAEEFNVDSSQNRPSITISHGIAEKVNCRFC